MSGLAGIVYKHRKLTALIWVVLLVGIFSWSQKVGSAYSDSFTLPNTQSKIALDLLTAHNPGEKGASIQVVFAGKNGAQVTQAEVNPIDIQLKGLAHVASVQSPFAPNSSAISKDGTVAFSTVYLDSLGNAIPIPAIKAIIKSAQSFQSSTLQIELLGNVIQQANQAKPGSSEGIAL